MNWKQIICLLAGLLVLAGMILFIPVSIEMMSLAVYVGDYSAGSVLMTDYRFMPEGCWPRCANFGVLFCEVLSLAGIVSCQVLPLQRAGSP